MNSYFKFKKFTIVQDRCAMKVGTDGVLLGAWCSINGKNGLDIGTGTGVIAIMLAQRNSELHLTGIEVDPQAAGQATENMKHSPWPERLDCILGDFKNFYAASDSCFDIIVSNPPYFLDSLKSPVNERNMARHAEDLSYQDLMNGVQKLLSDQGIFSVILPYVEGNLFIVNAIDFGLHCTRKTSVYSKKGKKIKRLLLEFRKQPVDTLRENTLYIEGEEINSFTDEYRSLTTDFYLKF